MRRMRLTLGASVAAATAVVLLLGGIFRDSSSATTSPSIEPPAATGAVPGRLLGRRQQHGSSRRASSRPSCAPTRTTCTSLDALGLAYQQRARETGDPAYYTKSEQALNRALRLAPRDLIATSGLGSLALSRHRFAEALVLGRKAHAISPTTALNYGITGDALVELGRYPAAFEAFDTMATLRPGLSSYARVSHGLELLGRVPEAIETMKLAVQAAAGPGRARGLDALPARQALLVDRPRRLQPSGRTAPPCSVFPGYHYALDALSRIEAAKGHNRAAIALEQQAVDRIPLPQYVAQLGDLYRVDGQPAGRRASSTR